MEFRDALNAELLAELTESFGEVPAWIAQELQSGVTGMALEVARYAHFVQPVVSLAVADPILVRFAEHLRALAPSDPERCGCEGRLRLRELLLAAAASETKERRCVVGRLGLGGPCSFRCQPASGSRVMPMIRLANRYIDTRYRARAPLTLDTTLIELSGAPLEAIERIELSPMPLERE